MSAPLRVGSLFAGIGGFDLGFERAGMHTAFFVEREPFCHAVLRRHWPSVPIFDDVCTVGAHNLPAVDVLCGGFPCQDLSAAGKGAGLDGARSGLWSEFARLIGELGPRWVVVENVPMLRSRGLGRVLGDLAALGYDAEWDCVPAQAVGAPHRRDRIWIVAYPNGDRESDVRADGEASRGAPPVVRGAACCGTYLADPSCVGGRPGVEEARDPGAHRGESGDSGLPSHPWAIEPDVGRVAHGVPARVDRLRALGNALVPQIAEEIGRRIMSYELAQEVA